MNLEGRAPRAWLAGWYAVHTATQHPGVWSPENAPAIRTALETRTEGGLPVYLSATCPPGQVWLVGDELAAKIRSADEAMRAVAVDGRIELELAPRVKRMRWCPHGPDFLVREEPK